MSRWTQQLENHPIWTTARTIRDHLSVEWGDVSDELFSEKRRLEQFVTKLFETLDALDAEQTPFNRLDDLDNQLKQNIVSQTHSYSTNGDVQYLRAANDQLQNPLSEICILRWCTQPISEQGKLEQLNELADQFVSKVNSKRNEFIQQSTEIEQTMEQQKQRLNELAHHIEKKMPNSIT